MGLVFLVGGARSGKSALALRLAQTQKEPVVWLATAEPGDPEMVERIDRHRLERPAEWATVEEALRLREALAAIDVGCCVVIDCLTLWVANSLRCLDPAAIEEEAAETAELAAARASPTIAISNEVGLGLVPAHSLGRSYRDLLGRVNAHWAAAAHRSYLLVAGRVLPLEAAERLVELL